MIQNIDEDIKDKLKSNIAFLKLKDLGIKKVVVEFSGSGDSGDIDDTTYYLYNDDIVQVEDSIHEIIQDLSWKLLQTIDSVGDWVNNEGGFGTLSLFVETKSYDLDYSQRTTEEHNWEDCDIFN